jgi:hypothetical protein
MPMRNFRGHRDAVVLVFVSVLAVPVDVPW